MLMLIGSGWNKKTSNINSSFIDTTNKNKSHVIKLPFEKNISYS